LLVTNIRPRSAVIIAPPKGMTRGALKQFVISADVAFGSSSTVATRPDKGRSAFDSGRLDLLGRSGSGVECVCCSHPRPSGRSPSPSAG
jgi:hypothetical protein